MEVRGLWKCGAYGSAGSMEVRGLWKCGVYGSAGLMEVCESLQAYTLQWPKAGTGPSNHRIHIGYQENLTDRAKMLTQLR